MSTIVLIILILLLIGALPAWPYSRGWGYYPSGGLGLILIIVIIIALLGAISLPARVHSTQAVRRSFRARRAQTRITKAMEKKKWNAIKAFAIELVRKKTKAEQKRTQPSAKAFATELVIFTGLVVCYFFFVLSLLSHRLDHLFQQNKVVYAFVAWVLIAGQSVILEVIAAALLKIVRSKDK